MRSFFESQRNRSILLLVFSLLSMLVLAGRALFVGIQGLSTFFTLHLAFMELAPSILEALSMFVCIILLVPLVVGCIRQLRGKPLPPANLPPVKGGILLLLAGAWVALLAVVSLLTVVLDFGWLLAAPAFIVAMLISILALAWIGAGGLPGGSRRRLWAALGLGMTGSTGLAILLEYALVVIAVGIAAVVIALRPELMQSLQALRVQLQGAGNNMEEMLTVLAPIITNPWVFLAILALIAVLGPLIEEAVKPLAVWFLGKRLRSPAEGFALGALSGAGFALLEGLIAASGMVETPYFGLPARMASSLMHITLSAVMGWGIASAVLEKRWKRLIGIYLLCVTLHGLWNGSAMLAVYGSLRITLQAMNYDPVSLLATGFGLLVLFTVLVIIAVALPLMNRRLRRAQDVIIPPLASQNERIPDGLDSQGG